MMLLRLAPLALLAVAPPTLALMPVFTPAGLDGPFVVVGMRAAGDVQGPPLDGTSPYLGATVTFAEQVGGPLEWLDGRSCDSFGAVPMVAPPPGGDGPILSDLQLTPLLGEGYRTHPLGIRLTCDGLDLAELVQFDLRVFATRTPNGAAWLILERPLPEKQAVALERGLAAAGYDPGQADGIIDAATRRAAGNFAEAHGAAYRFIDTAITQNLLDIATN